MKAKDLLSKDLSKARANALEDIEQDSDNPEKEDQVTAAYENISKKLDSIRNGIHVDESEESEGSKAPDDSDEPELEEWKGPKPPKLESEEPEEDEHELRKVNLRNLEDDLEEPEGEDDKESNESDESKESKVEKSSAKTEKDWKPVENDPLDDEDVKEEPFSSAQASADKEEQEESDDMEADLEKDEPLKEAEVVEKNTEKAEDEEMTANEKPEDKESGGQDEIDGPDTLDDLADESPLARGSGNEPVGESRKDEPALSNEPEEEDYAIPNLKGSRQTGGNIGYNAHPQRESFGQSYSPKGNNMDGNDPNNFFSQHQPQPAKRANKFHLLVLVVIGIIVIGFTVYILKGGFGDINLGTSPSPSPSPVEATPLPTPTPTPEPEVDRGAFTVKVLNGTTTSGLAGKVRDKLKELGYKTATPGNNSKTDIEQTEIRIKEGTESAALFERLKLDLAPDYEAKEGEKLDEKAAYDAEVIIGAK